METTDQRLQLPGGNRRFNRRALLRGTIGVALGATSASLVAACTAPTAPAPTAAAPAKPAAPPTSAPAKPPAAPAPPTAVAASKPAAGAAPAVGKVRDLTFLLDITPYGKHALFYAGVEHGEFAKHGFNVKFEAAKGSGDSAAKIGAKAADLGFADSGSSILAIGQGAKIKEIFMVHYKNLMSIIALKKSGINGPKDLEGQTIAATSGDAPRVLLPVLAKINGFDAAKVNLLTVDQPAKAATILAGRANGAMDFYTAWPAYVSAAKQLNEEMTALLYADHGLDIYNNGIIAHEDVLKNDASMVREFLQALGEAMAWAVENPDDATRMSLKYNPALEFATARAQLQVAIDFLMVPEVKQHGIGPMEQAKMQRTLDVMSENFQLGRKIALEEVWSNEFAPKGLIPKA